MQNFGIMNHDDSENDNIHTKNTRAAEYNNEVVIDCSALAIKEEYQRLLFILNARCEACNYIIPLISKNGFADVDATVITKPTPTVSPFCNIENGNTRKTPSQSFDSQYDSETGSGQSSLAGGSTSPSPVPPVPPFHLGLGSLQGSMHISENVNLHTDKTCHWNGYISNDEKKLTNLYVINSVDHNF